MVLLKLMLYKKNISRYILCSWLTRYRRVPFKNSSVLVLRDNFQEKIDKNNRNSSLQCNDGRDSIKEKRYRIYTGANAIQARFTPVVTILSRFARTLLNSMERDLRVSISSILMSSNQNRTNRDRNHKQCSNGYMILKKWKIFDPSIVIFNNSMIWTRFTVVKIL